MKFSIGTQSFENIRERGHIYVDKTDLIYKMADNESSVFLGRPRRFGKSLLISTLQAYFEGKKELFKGLAIDKLEKDWKKYPVLRFSFSRKTFNAPGKLEKSLNEQLGLYESIYGINPIFTTPDGRLLSLIMRAYEQTGNKTVVLIDEYDKPMLDALDTPLEEENRDMLREFYSTFKDADDYLRFLFFTGITKFSQVSVFSGINQLRDISMSSQYEAICGITEEELYTIFPERIAEFAEKEQCSIEEMKLKLKRQYDGYHFTEDMTDIYNPFSILNSLSDINLRDYWFKTATPSYLVKLMNHFNENIEDITDKYYAEAAFVDYKADVAKPLPMIYQSGYLTISEYNNATRLYKLDFPNDEVRRGFVSLLSAGYFNNDTNDVVTKASQMDDSLRKGKLEDFIKHMNAYLASIQYDAHGPLKDMDATEKFFQMIFFITMTMVGGNERIFLEKRSCRGRADCVIKYSDYVYILEFKLDGTAEQALRQIDEKGYAEPYAADPRKVVKVGINFSSEKRVITEWLAEPLIH